LLVSLAIKEENMKKKDKLLLFLALNTVITPLSGAAPKYEKLYDKMVKNINSNKSNDESYKLITRILNQRNKELTDLYLQSDYVIKPEYLEWQIFFSGFYNEYNEGVDNTAKSAKYNSKVDGYYDSNGNFIVTSGTINGLYGKPLLPLQQPKEIDLGIGLFVKEPDRQPVSTAVTKPSAPSVTPVTPESPQVDAVVPVIPPIKSFTVPSISAPTPPAAVTITPPAPTTVVVGSFDPINPVITPPATFDPPLLNFIATGFGQGRTPTLTITADTMINNFDEVIATTPVTVTTGASPTISGDFSYRTAATTNYYTGTSASNAKPSAIINSAADIDVVIAGDWIVNNNSPTGQVRFISLNPYDVGRSPVSRVFDFQGNLTLNNQGTQPLTGIEHQLLTYQPASNTSATSILKNTGTITLASGSYIVGINIDSEGAQFVTPAETINEGKIIINSDNSIGVDFGQYYNGLNALLKSGYIEVNNHNNYGLRVKDIFTDAYYDTTYIDGSKSSFGGIEVNGTNNVGISLEKRIGTVSDIIANITNLNIKVNGTQNVGFLRSSNYNSLQNGIMSLTNTNIESLEFGDTASNSTLIRTDKFGISLDRNITVNNSNAVNTAVNNVILLANDKTSLGSQQTFVRNNAVLTIGNNMKNTTGILAINGGYGTNTGTININGQESQGIAVFGASGGTIATGSNSGTINITGQKSVGVYNAGSFTMGSGSIVSSAVNAIGIYSDNTTTTVSGGTVTAKDGGIALFSGDNSTINLSGSNILKAEAGGLLFYNYLNSSNIITGKYNITAPASAQVDEGGMLLYTKVDSVSDISTVASSLKAAFTNAGNLTVNMAPGSSILYVDTAGASASITAFTGLPDLTTGFFNFVGSGYKGYVMNGFNLSLDDNIESNLDTGSYGKILFLNSDITVTNGTTVEGNTAGQVAIVQKNKSGSLNVNDRKLTNNGTILLTGNKSTGIAGDYTSIKNTSTGQIKLGTNSIGIYTANGSEAVNSGLIEFGTGSVGIYGQNYFDGTKTSSVLGYGNDKINITNEKDIKTISGGVTGDAFGIYSKNILNANDASISLTSSSNIDLKGTGTVIGVYSEKSDISNNGIIKVDSATSGVGIYALAGSTGTGTNNTGSIEVTGGNSVGIFAENSNIAYNGNVKLDNVTSGIGMYSKAAAGNTSSITNNGTLSLGANVTGMYSEGFSSVNFGSITNTGTITSLASSNKVIGMYIGSNGTGTNTGSISLTALGTDKSQVGVYNSGEFNMNAGNIYVSSQDGAGLYTTGSTTVTNLSGGTITAGNGAVGIYMDNSVVNLSGSFKSVVNDGGIFALGSGTGKLNVSGNVVVDIDSGGIAFSSLGDLATYLGSFVTGSGVLELNLKSDTSKLAILDSPLSPITLSSVTTSFAPGANITTNVKISSTSNPNYIPFSLLKGKLVIDENISLDNNSLFYNRSDFINSSIDISSANIISGSGINQLAVGQVNYGSGSLTADRDKITINNTGTIDLSGNNSTGILTDFGKINNTGTVKVSGTESVALYGANGSLVTNNGTLNIGSKSIGIYGTNYLLGTAETYGTGKIKIENNSNIISTDTTHGGFGIYVKNDLTQADSVIDLNTGSNIDVSSGNSGIGVYVTNSTLNVNDGTITVGKNGIGIYASNSTGTIGGGTINLHGDNAVGYYLTNGSTFSNTGGAISVNGQNITLVVTDAGSSLTTTNPFTITSTPGSTYVFGNMIGGDYYNSTSASLGSNGSLINGLNTIVLFGAGSNITSTGNNVSGMVLSGQYASKPFYFSGEGYTATEEGTNLGNISLADSSAGMYLSGGASGRNEGTISIGKQSVGMYASGTGSYAVNNNGIINVDEESTGIFLSNGIKAENLGTAEINGTGQKAVGIYSENISGSAVQIINDNKINLSGDNSMGIYSTGNHNISNTGNITIGNSSNPDQPGVGIYQDNVSGIISNAGNISVGDNSIGIYNNDGTVVNSGSITAGNGGTGIYSNGGILTLNSGSSIAVGGNNSIGVYALNQTGTVTNNSSISVGDSSYGFVFSGNTAPSFVNSHSAVIGNDSIFTFSDSHLDVVNNAVITMTGSNNIAYYLKNSGSVVNNADIIGNTGTSNIGVYAKNSNITNNADIIIGDSILTEYTDSNGSKYKTGYSVGIYGENANITNSAGSTIQIGSDGIGIYSKGPGVTENYGTIIGTGDNAKGIFADNSTVRNYGTISLTGDNVIGLAGQNGADIYNDTNAVINVTGNNVTGIYLAGDATRLVNKGIINITGTGLGISYTPTVELGNIFDDTGTSKGSTSKYYDLPDMPSFVNSGVININVGGNFNYDGIRVIVTIDPSTNTPTTNSSNQVGFGGVIPERIEVAPDFATGTAADRYVFENIFKGTTGKGEYISQSLTWDATASGSDLVMTRKDYKEFTEGLWYEEFSSVLNDKYAVTTGEGRKIYDKINQITDEYSFRDAMSSLAGDIYANMNQREYDIARSFENSLAFMQNSENNTKENVKINIIGGKGKNKEETDGVTGYDYATAGILALREVERTYRHTFGYSLGYLHTGFDINDGNNSEDKADTIQLGVHNKYEANGWKLKNDLTGRVSFHDVDRNINWQNSGKSTMSASYQAYGITSDNILGKGFDLSKNVSIMPYGAFKAMYVTRPTFSEDGLERLKVEGNDAWSAKPRAGVELQGELPLGKSQWSLKGNLDFAYEYELADLNTRERAKLITIEDGYHKLSKPEEEKGSFRTRAEIGMEIKDRYGIFLTGEYSIGNDDREDYRAGVSFKAAF
jgi:hypothetical protein